MTFPSELVGLEAAQRLAAEIARRRRAQVLALAERGVGVQAIADTLGVSEQRVRALIREATAGNGSADG
jgi:DNA-binding NarL/FixJ family response regulator